MRACVPPRSRDQRASEQEQIKAVAGPRTCEWWLDAHREYFRRQAAREGFTMHDCIETVFERFEIMWPPSAADRTEGAER
jgi:hypothetical protein